MKRLFVIITLCLLLCTNVFANDFKVRSFIGGYDLLVPGFPEQINDTFWYSISVGYEKDINKNFSYSNYLGFGLIGARDASAPFLEYRFLPKFKYKDFYFIIGGGIAHGANPDDLPHLADSPLYGIISSEIGYRINERISVGYGIEHISSPFHDDSGLNVGAVVITVSF